MEKKINILFDGIDDHTLAAIHYLKNFKHFNVLGLVAPSIKKATEKEFKALNVQIYKDWRKLRKDKRVNILITASEDFAEIQRLRQMFTSKVRVLCGTGLGLILSTIAQVERSTDRLQVLDRAVEQSPSVIVVTDKEGDIEYVNPKFTEQTGYSYKEVLGENPRILKSGDKSSDEYKGLWDTITAGKEWRGDFHNKRKNGEIYWERASISPIRNHDGSITHFIKVGEDMTEHKLLEDLKDEFIATVSHELRTPLTIINESMSLVLDCTLGDINEDQKKFLTISKNNINRLSRLINDLLDMSKIESGKIKVFRRRVNVNRIIEQVVLSFEDMAGQKGVKILKSLPKKALIFRSDQDMLIQILTNLLSNAVKFTNKGHVKIGLTKVKNGVEITVKDTGVGISEDNMGHVFDKFRQFGKKGSVVSGGTGLGLNIAKSLVTLMDGQISVKSKLGVGTKFHIFLPEMKK